MRWLLRLFPVQWRARYGEEFLEQFADDRRRVAKWIDVGRTAAALRWESFRASGDGLAVSLVGALVLVLGCDAALGVGMDERIDVELLSHWWGAPFAAVLGASAAMTAAALVAVLGDRRRRRALAPLTAGVAASAAVGSAVLAAVSFDLAALGAGIGLTIGAVTLRVVLHTPLTRVDGLVLVALPIILILGWRTASSPVGPLSLLVVGGALLTTRVGGQAVHAPASRGQSSVY